MSWVFLAIGAVLVFTTLNLLQRVLAVKSENPRAMAVIFNFAAALLALIIFLFTGNTKDVVLPSDPMAWIGLLIASLGYGLFGRGRFTANKLLDASVFITILNVSVLVAFTGSLFLYSESLSFAKVIGGLLILGALLLVSVNKSAKKSSRMGIIIATFISIALGIGWMLDKQGTYYFGSELYNILIWTIPLVVIYFPHIEFKEIAKEFKLSSWKTVVLAGLNVIGYLLQLKALELAEATRVIPLLQTNTLLTILMGTVVLKEREHIKEKIIAGIMAVAGAYLLI